MSKSVIIIGGKSTNIQFEKKLDSYDYVCRINMCTKYKRDNNEKDIFYVNNHVYDHLFKFKLGAERLKKSLYHYVELQKLVEMHTIVSNKNYYEVIQQYESGVNTKSNAILKEVNCPFLFKKAPRCGYQAILHYIKKNYKITVSGFSFKQEENITESNINKSITVCHDPNNEYKILQWLHEKNYIDATLCMLENHKDSLPLLNCQYFKPSKCFLEFCIKEYGICILKNYYSKDKLSIIKEEFTKIFNTNSKNIEILDKEDCSNDERIFFAEKYSNVLKELFANNTLFNDIAKQYNQKLNKKTLINKLLYENGKLKNSGAGWHRDNHHCQFKTIMYLTNCYSKNGPFTWITNSSKKYIGFPKPRTQNYNTRFHDETVEEIIKKNDKCKKVEICGDEGTIILADTTYIHRGKIIEEGIRHAITQYYF